MLNCVRLLLARICSWEKICSLPLQNILILYLGNFAARPLPSSGLFPFMSGILCQLLDTCQSLPQDTDAPPLTFTNFTNNTNSNSLSVELLTEFLNDLFQFANQPQVVNATTVLAVVLRDIFQEQNNAAKITRSLNLSQYTYSNLSDFTSGILNSTNDKFLVDALLESNPNYNFLYSNYSQTIYESNTALEFTLSDQNRLDTIVRPLNIQVSLFVARSLVDIIYGPDLAVNKIVFSNCLKSFEEFKNKS